MKSVAYIHGFNSTHRSFTYLTMCLPEHNIVRVNYDSHQSLGESVIQVAKQLPKKPIALVGHSLGGLIAALLVKNEPDRFTELITISSPIGGSKEASLMRWIPGHPTVLSDITPNSQFVRSACKFESAVPTLSIISTGGSIAAISDANDSIVSVSSQQALLFGKKVEVKINHFEILMHEKTVELIKQHLFHSEKPNE